MITDTKHVLADNLIKVMDSQQTKLSSQHVLAQIEKPKQQQMGDFAYPTFQLASVLHKSPQVIANELGQKLSKTSMPLIEKIEVKGSYVNFFLDKKAVTNKVIKEILKQGTNYGNSYLGNKQKVVIDMSSPNIAKPMSMGHLRSTVIGNAVANLLKKTGYQVIKDNHLGDWGTQFGKLMVAYLKWGNEADVKRDPIKYLVQYYIKFHQLAKTNPDLDKEARQWFKKLEKGDKQALALWQWFHQESLKAFNTTYRKLGVTFDTYLGESFYNDKLYEVQQLLQNKNLLTSSRGAQVVDLSADELNPALILKSDGTSLYITRDIATELYRERHYHPAKILIVMGSEQSYYFKQLKAVLTKMGIKNVQQLTHVPFGLITVNGKKLSTRAGRIILLDEVLDQAIKLALTQIEQKNPQLPNKQAVAKEVGIGAVIFGDLKNERINNIDFIIEDQLKFEGETGPYVQYSRVRAESVLQKAPKLAKAGPVTFDNVTQVWPIITLLQSFPQVIKKASLAYEPSLVAKYVLHLAKAFNKYYAQSKILVENKNLASRLQLVESVSLVLKEGLRLLGIKAPNKM